MAIPASLTQPSYGRRMDSKILRNVPGASPLPKRVRTERCWWAVSFGLRPMRLPASIAKRRPSWVRFTILMRSRSATATFGCGQIQGREIEDPDRGAGSSTCLTICNPSHMDRVALSHSANNKMSPGARAAIALASSGRPSKLLPEGVSVKILMHRSAFNARTCRDRSCPAVLTRA